LLFGLTISCSAPRNFKHGAKSNGKNNTNIETNAENFYNNSQNVADSKEIARNRNANNAAQDSGMGDSNESWAVIPILQDQMQEIKFEQNEIKSRLNSLENDVSYLKSKYGSDNSHNVNSTKETIAGEKPANIILSDEVVVEKPVQQKTSTKKQDAPSEKQMKKAGKKPAKIKKTSHSSSVKSESQTNKPSEPAVSRKSAPAANTDAKPDENKAVNALVEGRYDESLNSLITLAASEKNPQKLNQYHYYIGESYFGLKQYEQAVGYFNKVIKSNNATKKAEAQMMLGETLLRLGQTDEARKALETMVENYPRNQYSNRARKLLQQI
jgi:TolA-binding protein